VTWESHRESLVDVTATATPAQRLAWLEEALLLAYRFGALPVRSDADETGPQK
jgi:hypothetical protein